MATPTGGQAVSEVQLEEPDSESDDDDEVVETSPCGRWEKHKKELSQKNGPGIDRSFLAMDTEEGVEVVWNEVRFSERKSMKNKEETLKKIFENLTQLDHANISKFHKYWIDTKGEYPRVIFISEYMTSGSLRQFLKKTRANIKSFNIKGWKRWCKQILSALGYLHGHKDYPIVHGNLNCDTIFIQHNGLMKIGTVAPDAINNYVKTYKHQRRNMHFIAPEYDGESLFSALSSEDYGTHGVNGRPVNSAADIYSFGIVALEMATLQWAEASTTVTPEMIQNAIESLEEDNQRDFIQKCLQKNPAVRPSVRNLLVHPIMLEVYSLKILAGHAVVDADLAKQVDDSEMEEYDLDSVVAEMIFPDGRETFQYKYNQVQPLELEKFLEEIKTGLYPLTGMESTKTKKETRQQLNHSRPKSPEDVQNSSQGSEEEELKEVRQIIQITCTIKQQEDGSGKTLNLLLKLEDRMNRQLSRKITEDENPVELAKDLVHHGLISEVDIQKVASKIDESLKAPA